MNPKILLTHPGTQYSYHLAHQLYRLNLLHKYVTGFTIPNGGVLNSVYKKLPTKYQVKLGTRVINLPPHKVLQHPLLELRAIMNIRKGIDSESAFYGRNKQFQERISDKLLKEADIIIGFDTSSWILAERCKKLNKRFILDVSIGHPVAKEAVYQKLTTLYPEWQEQIKPKSQFLIDLEAKEIELADTIVVPSNFVRNTYIENGIDPNKIKVNPFGTDVANFSLVPHQNMELSFLFFGGLTARKGLPFLLEVWQQFVSKYPQCKLLLAGYGHIPENYTLPAGVKDMGLIAPKNRQALFNMADVFVFPSFFEGLAQVQIEAAACGLPVIGSTQSGAGDLVVNAESGFVITPGVNDELFKAMEYFVSNPQTVDTMGIQARNTALNGFTWDAYGDRWNKIVH